MLTDESTAPIMVGLDPGRTVVEEIIFKENSGNWHTGSKISIPGLSKPVIVRENPTEVFELYKGSK